MKKMGMVLSWLLVFLLGACSMANVDQIVDIDENQVTAIEERQEGVTPEQAAQAVMVTFYDLLNQGEYEKAVELYGGSYEALEYFNPVMDAADRAGLLTAACEINGFICAPVLSVTAIGSDHQGILAFEVVYANPDGSRFVLGPCCGATEEEMPPVDVFTVRVNCERENECQVLDLPPWIP